jgi:hypothetical protein
VEVRLFASDDATLDQSDVQLLNTKPRVVLPPGRSRRIALRPGKSSLFLPAPAYYLFARVDAGEAIVEASHSDNVSPAPAAAIPLTAPAGKRSARHPESLFASGAVLPG